MLQQLKNKRGFTLIEIVIVLAIASLIILVVLQAVTAAQRSQRDSARKQEAGRISALMEQFASNNGGTYPLSGAAADTALDTYDAALGAKYTGQGAVAAYVAQPGAIADAPACGVVTPVTFQFRYYPSTAAAPRDYRLGVCLEAGGFAVIK
jgi:type IV pilus assembly protein PilA